MKLYNMKGTLEIEECTLGFIMEIFRTQKQCNEYLMHAYQNRLYLNTKPIYQVN